MTKAAKPAAVEPGELDPMKMRVRVVAPLGARRRAGISFSSVPADLTMADLGEDMEAARKALEILMADPQLSVAPLVEEGAMAPADEGGKQD